MFYDDSTNNGDFETVKLELSDFQETMIDGTIIPNKVPLNKSDIRTFGIQNWGVFDYLDLVGPATLEIDYVKLTK